MSRTVHHALMLNLHQPAGNLEDLLESNEWEVREILFAMDRMPRMLWDYADTARVHLSLSGTLLETLCDPNFQSMMYGVVKLGDLLWHLQNEEIFSILGTGYYHPVLPLIPEADWDEQLMRWRGIGERLFSRRNVPGFWPPEMSFCMELIPHLKKAGYRDVIVDCENIEPVEDMRWEEIRYRPHIAEYGGEEIIVIPRDRSLSDSQESGFDTGWFMHEVHERTKHCEFEPLVTTATDGENGGWFRNINEKGNFWGTCYQPLLDKVRAGETEIRPTFIHDYLDKCGTSGKRVTVKTAAWNTGWHSGEGFTQWVSSPLQKDGLRRTAAVSQDVRTALTELPEQPGFSDEIARMLEEAHWHVLRAETSCNFFWGENWVYRAHDDLNEALVWLGRAKAAQTSAAGANKECH